jgi:HSP20 family protein
MTAYLDLWNPETWNVPFTLAKNGERAERFAPSLDVEETETQYLVNLDIPGVSKDDVKIEMLNDELVISGERKPEKAEGKQARHVVERSFGRFQRTLALPKTVQADRVEAFYKDGVLKISVPKAEAAKPKKIEIRDVA